MGWILSIFNVVLLLFLLSCARVPEVSRVKKSPSPRPVKKLVSGPTRSVLSREIASKSFGEVSAEIGLAGLNGVHLYGVDFDGDSYTDLVILPDFYSIPQFFRFHPSSKKFRKLTYSPFKSPTRASFLGFADFNKDGLLDLVMGTLNQRSALTPRPLMLFQGIKTDGRLHYKEVPKAFPKNIDPVASIAFIDYDLDGFLDIYVGNWYVRSQSGKTTLAPDRLYKGDQFRFVDHSHVLEGEFDFNRSYESYPNARPTFGVSVCDIDQNGYPDILTAASGGFGNRLWLSMPSKKVPRERVFRDHGEQSGYAFDDDGKHTTRGGGNSGYTKCADYNNDGAMDVAVGEIFHSYENSVRDRSGVLTGTTRGFPLRFLRASYYFDNGKKSWSQGDRRGLWFDYNSDGLLDLLVNNSGFPPNSRLVLFEQQSDHELVDRAEVLRVNILNPSGSIMFDFNRDGYPDIITGQRTTRRPDIKTRLYAFANHSTPKGKAFRFYLRGKKSNVHAYGGTLFLKSSKKRYLRVVEDFYGSLPSQNEEGVFFTLPFGERLESVEVRWPILKKSSSGRFYPLSKTYKLKIAKHKNYQPFTLCENGRWYRGRRKSCP